jgi:hypothetical protein
MSISLRASAARSRLSLTALALVVGVWTAVSCCPTAYATPRSPSAHAARTVFLYENAYLRLTHTNNESTLNERGNAYGTFRAPLTAFLRVSAEHVNAVFTIYPRGGSITGKASASFKVQGHTCYYGGLLTITQGTGPYRHASGKNIGISGTIDRISFALTVKAKGWMKL